jgi:hypothetical protein
MKVEDATAGESGGSGARQTVELALIATGGLLVSLTEALN